MREILFRGQNIETGKWVVDNSVLFFRNSTKIYGALNGWREVEVFPETIGQYTGLTDKNGTKIFEGDIVKRHWFDRDCIYRIDYDKGLAAFIGQRSASYITFDYDAVEFEVIGNIYDNPELLRSDTE